MTARRACIAIASLAAFSTPTVAQQAQLGASGAHIQEFREQSGKRLTFVCPPDQEPGTVYGTDVYTDDSSICGAAVHAGVISADRGGPVTIVIAPGQTQYRGSTRNGVTSKDYADWEGSFSFDRRGTAGRIGWGTTAKGAEGYTGPVSVICPAGGRPRQVWGTDSYTGDSSICTAALHAGTITLEKGGPVTITLAEGRQSFKGSRRNGVASESYGSYPTSFTLGGERTLATTPMRTGEALPAATDTASAPAATTTTRATTTRNAPVATRDPCTMSRTISSDTEGQPCITRIAPDSAAHRMQVVIWGTGLTGTRTTIGGAVTPATVYGDTLIKTSLVEGATSGAVVVTNTSSGKSQTRNIRIIAPRISYFSPRSGRAGDKIKITGYGFADDGNGTGRASFGFNQSPSVTVEGTGTYAEAYVPAGNSTGIISVVGVTGVAKSAEEFIELPTIDATAQAVSVPPDGTISITGKALQNITEVVIGSQPGTIVSKSYNNLSFKLPAVVQNTATTTAFGQASFTHRIESGATSTIRGGPQITVTVQPAITALQPDSGVSCESAALVGTGLSTSGTNTTPIVQIGNAQSPYAYFSNYRTIAFTIPQSAATGPVKLQVNGQHLVSPTPFRIIPPVPTAVLRNPPSVIQPGTVLRFNGRLREVTKVTFAGGVELTQGWTAAPIYNSSSCEDLFEVTVPTGAVSGPVTFTNPRGTTSVNLTITP